MKLTIRKTQLKQLSDKHANLPVKATPQIGGGLQGASISGGVLCVIVSLIDCTSECTKLACPQR
ncbi:hypothetical protein ACSLBF_10205 [Pseudoalteromonas sp. T1lg65]|uniref:hypothetical protein n=1 Tax=Pseudoalteromonas sp. T1lg65 TaxID=2077101 RepID=UPI003F7B0954